MRVIPASAANFTAKFVGADFEISIGIFLFATLRNISKRIPLRPAVG